MITIYTRNGCSFCEDIKFFMKQNGIKFLEKNLSEKKIYYDELVELGATGVPYTLIKNQSYTGFNEIVKTELSNYDK
ncbi:glutaredoxin family protein [Alkalihalophilus marmarensis]|uniref:glutaredoxin family protein n=1 Tax=Alkalihalophilus marmarensis TaxID=521377 RepID=UPI002DBB81AE|nr:glutaredoxin family protein [Alkalihalophilus marmarensis]MEC2074419.1 glutaredoxin family protein [Alkalihalophilus marmarensis]